jgi:hypothetical protein
MFDLHAFGIGSLRRVADFCDQRRMEGAVAAARSTDEPRLVG